MVKVTYQGLIFLYDCLFVYGVSRELGLPSGGWWRWWANGWNERRQGWWARFRISVLGRPSGAGSIWLEPLGLARIFPGWARGCTYVL